MTLADTAKLTQQAIQAVYETKPQPDLDIDAIFSAPITPQAPKVLDCPDCGCPDCWLDPQDRHRCVACQPPPRAFRRLVRGVFRVTGRQPPYSLEKLHSMDADLSLGGYRPEVAIDIDHAGVGRRVLRGPYEDDLAGTSHESHYRPDGAPWWLFGEELTAWRQSRDTLAPCGPHAGQSRPAGRCSGCGGTEHRDIPIHDGRSVRRDCARCGRLFNPPWPVWYGVANPACLEYSDPIALSYGAI